MVRRIILTHDDPAFSGEAGHALEDAGYEVATFATPLDALRDLDAGKTFDLMIVGLEFPYGTLNGLSLVRMALLKGQGDRALFVAPGKYEHLTEGVGHFISQPTTSPALLAMVERCLQA